MHRATGAYWSRTACQSPSRIADEQARPGGAGVADTRYMSDSGRADRGSRPKGARIRLVAGGKGVQVEGRSLAVMFGVERDLPPRPLDGLPHRRSWRPSAPMAAPSSRMCPGPSSRLRRRHSPRVSKSSHGRLVAAGRADGGRLRPGCARDLHRGRDEETRHGHRNRPMAASWRPGAPTAGAFVPDVLGAFIAAAAEALATGIEVVPWPPRGGRARRRQAPSSRMCLGPSSRLRRRHSPRASKSSHGRLVAAGLASGGRFRLRHVPGLHRGCGEGTRCGRRSSPEARCRSLRPSSAGSPCPGRPP